MPPHVTPSTRRLALLLGGLAMFGPFSIDTIFPGFPSIGAQLGADPFRMQQTISIYLVAYALMSVVHGPLSDAFGRRPVILGGLAVFAAASVGCALSTGFGELLAWRALQGLSAGVGIIVGRAVIRDLLHGDDAQRLMSQVSMIFGIAPAVAPVVGGWLLGWQRWPAIFWFLVAFALALLVATWIALPETHPKSARLAPEPRALLRDYAGIFLNPRFQRLAAAASFNFGALFLYIASAPAFVLDLLRLHGRHLHEDEFAWFFVPMIGGMTLGALVSGRMAGRVGGEMQTRIGFACCGVAMAVNLAYNALAPSLDVPLAIAPMMLYAFGIGLVFPILTLAILDMYPRHRGSASSLQAFTGLVCNAVIAGVLSPLLSGSGLHLAAGAAVFAFLGWAVWRREMRAGTRLPAGDRDLTAALEPTDRL